MKSDSESNIVNVDDFIERQLTCWPDVAMRFNQLDDVLTKSVGGYRVQFNPARAVSTAAKVDAATIAARPCFLCRKNRPSQQLALDWEDLEILVNPFPIFPGHLTIAAKQHVEQSLLGRTEQMRRLSLALPGYTIFFNGAKSGASAPDHMHFQAVPSKYMQVSDLYFSYKLPEAVFSPEEIDPMINCVCTDGKITVIPRRKHRPDCYGQLLVSPACIDLCGTLITVRREDFDSLDENQVNDIIHEVTFSEPPVYVGLITENTIMHSEDDGSTTIDGVTIGHGFHWQQRQTQRFAGQILTLNRQIINRVGVEEYLRSVISSEMSATSSIELLKAHAIISRSWLLAQMRITRSLADKGCNKPHIPLEDGEIRRWFDKDDHTTFDVCSDDHCQRYQGITRISTPAVDVAVSQTRGLILSANGRIVDARFSKCCGGAFEKFDTCWQNADFPYFTGHADNLTPNDLPDLSVEENARQWVLSRPEAFCASADDSVLSQVLNDFDRDSTPDFYRWSVRYTQKELSKLVALKSGIDFGEILDLIPMKRGTSGRISRLKIIGSKTTRIIGKELIIRRWLSPTHLFSSAFVVDRDGSDFILRGAGWGHGVGLCQIGASVMAAKGFRFEQILAHYFPGTQLTKFY